MRHTQAALLVAALAGCAGGGEPSAADVPRCDAPSVVEKNATECSLVFDGCSDDVGRELLCSEFDNGDGQYQRRLICECAEDRAAFSSVIIEDASCSDGADQPAVTYEAAWRACERDVVVDG